MKRLTTVTFLVMIGTSAPALAAATAEEASRLTSVFQAYFSAEPGVVSVTPSGDSYDAKLDLAPLLAKIKAPGFSAEISPIEMSLTSQGGGKWKVDQDQSFNMSFKADDKVDMKASIGGAKGSGIFDEALGTFASQSYDLTNLAFEQTVNDKGVTTNVSYTVASSHYEVNAEAGTGGVDGTSNWTFADLRETINVSSAPDGSTPPMQFSITAPSGSQLTTMKGLRTHETNALLAWLVAHPSPDAMKADQTNLKARLHAAIPLFQSIEGTGAINDMSVNTIMGRLGIANLDFLVSMNGIVDGGALREKISVSGLALPAGIVPPWAADLVPGNLTVDFNIADFNLAAPAKLIIDNFDLNQNPPLKPEMEGQLLQALMPNGTVTLGLGPSEVIAKLFDLKLEGSMKAGPVAPPSGQATVKLKGLDEVMAALQSAPPEMGVQQIAPMIIVAKGMAKNEADGTLTWNIESTPTGGVLVNGVDVTKMGGSQ